MSDLDPDDLTPVGIPLPDLVEYRLKKIQKSVDETAKASSQTAIDLKLHVDRDEAVNAANATVNANNALALQQQSDKIKTIGEDISQLKSNHTTVDGKLNSIATQVDLVITTFKRDAAIDAAAAQEKAAAAQVAAAGAQVTAATKVDEIDVKKNRRVLIGKIIAGIVAIGTAIAGYLGLS